MKHLYILIFIISTISYAQLTPPSDLQSYYSDVDFNKTGDALHSDLAANTIGKHTLFLNYSERHQFLYDADEDPTNTANVVLIYSGESRFEREYLSSGNSYSPQTFNTEHVYPRSLVENTAEADLHHLRVCDVNINSDRGNMPFATGAGSFGEVSGGWYPGDDWRGDVARMLMYMNLRYNESFDDVGSLQLFLQWNAADPVSEIEINRNRVISDVQGNRNPLIDNPFIATVIWGGPDAENRWATLSNKDFSNDEDFMIYPNPTKGNYINIKTNTNVEVGIYNVLGKPIGRYYLKPNQNQIDITGLSQGIYLVKINGEGRSSTRKLIKR